MEPESKRKRKSRFLPGLLFGLFLGWLSASLAPKSWQAYIPDALRPGGQVDGVVLEKSTETDRLLLKLTTEQGMILATFSERQEEIDLLVENGDTVTIRVQRYEPFLENPPIERVRKPTAAEAPPPPAPPEEISERLPEPDRDEEADMVTTSIPEDAEPH